MVAKIFRYVAGLLTGGISTLGFGVARIFQYIAGLLTGGISTLWDIM